MKRLPKIPIGFVTALAVSLAFVLGVALAPTVARAADVHDVSGWSLTLTEGDNVPVTDTTYTYDTYKKTPTMHVYPSGSGVIAKEGTTYKVTGTRSATNAGTYTITITGIGSCYGTKSVTWTINKMYVDYCAITQYANPTYDGTEKAVPIETFMAINYDAGKRLVVRPTDYVLTTYNPNEPNPFTNPVTPKNAGTYATRVAWSDSGNFTGAVTTVNWSILKASQTITAADVTLTYGDKDGFIGATGIGTITYEVTSGDKVISVDSNGAITTKAAGTATVNITASGDDNHESATKTVTVKVNLLADWYDVQVAAPTYDGTDQALLSKAETDKDCTIQFRLNESDEWSTTIPKGQNAGLYVVYYKISGENHQEQSGSLNVMIANAELTDVSVVQNGALTYDGTAQTAGVTTSATAKGDQDVTFTYSASEEGEYTTNVPSFTDAGDHTVYYKASALNHNDATGSFTVTIDPATLTNVSVTQTGTLTYDGTAQTAAVSASATPVGSQSVTFTYSRSGEDGTYTDAVPSFTNAGTHTVFYQASADNHKDATGSFTVTIGKRDITGATITMGDNPTYDGTVQTAPIKSVTKDGVAVNYYSIDSGGSATDVGTYTVVIGDNVNFTGTASAEWSILPAELTDVSVEQVGTLTYNGKAQRAAVKATATAKGDQLVTFTYSATKDGTYTSAVPAFTEPGTHVVYFRASAPNHLDYEGSFEVVIGKPAASGKSGKPGIPRAGDATPATASVAALAAAGGATVAVAWRLKRNRER